MNETLVMTIDNAIENLEAVKELLKDPDGSEMEANLGLIATGALVYAVQRTVDARVQRANAGTRDTP